MREIEFRGKSDDEWVYGMLLKTEEDDYGEHGNEHFDYLIQTEENKDFERSKFYITDNSTIGQYTGLKDKNGKKIYEGDIVKALFFGKEVIGTIEFIYGTFALTNSGISDNQLFIFEELEIIGNIWDNPELLNT